MRLSTATLTALMIGSTALAFGQTAQVVTGTVTDSMCGAHHMMKNATAAQCTRACVKNGADFALVSGSKQYTLKGDKSAIDKFAGQSVTVHGKVTGTTLAVDTITATK